MLSTDHGQHISINNTVIIFASYLNSRLLPRKPVQRPRRVPRGRQWCHRGHGDGLSLRVRVGLYWTRLRAADVSRWSDMFQRWNLQVSNEPAYLAI